MTSWAAVTRSSTPTAITKNTSDTPTAFNYSASYEFNVTLASQTVGSSFPQHTPKYS